MQTTYFWRKGHIEEVASRILWIIQVVRNRKVRKYEGIRFLGAEQIIYELWPPELWEKTDNYEKKIRKFWRTRSFCVFWWSSTGFLRFSCCRHDSLRDYWYMFYGAQRGIDFLLLMSSPPTILFTFGRPSLLIWRQDRNSHGIDVVLFQCCIWM